MNLAHGSLFSGVGGFELGAKWQGIPTKWSCEISDKKHKILTRHFPNGRVYRDIKQMQNPSPVDIISGGFPCQDISISQQSNGGAKGIKGDRSGLWSEMYRICRAVKPSYILIENSSMLAIRGLEYVLCDLAQIGYDAEWRCLRGFDFGLPDKRERIYIIAYSRKIGCNNHSNKTRIFREILPKRTPRQITLSMPIKRFKRRDNLQSLRMDNEFSKELDEGRIEAMGDAVKPIITSYLFKCIKEHHKIISK